MQLIQELTLVQKAGVFIGIPLILLFVFIASRRRRAASGVGEAAASTPKRGRSKKDSGVPRRKRRKLADEAAQSMGTAAVAQPEAPEPVAPAVEPVAIAESAPPSPAPEAVAAPAPPPVPVAAATVDDPYVQDISFADEQVAAFVEDTLPEVVVAAPGWPTPGELASSFDPDAFDPLPSAEPTPPSPDVVEDAFDEVLIDAEPEQPTGVIEMPVLHADAFAGHDEPEVAQWDGEFDPATGWGEDEVPVPVAVAAESEEWYDSDHATGGGGSSSDQPSPVDLDQFWSDADTEEPWSDASEVEILSDMIDEAPVPDWVHDDEPSAWASNTTEDAAPAAASAGHEESGWTMAAPVHGSPVVLDLAGLAASGHALELVIESSEDGKGVRLRFGSPSAAAASVTDGEIVPPPAEAMEESPADESDGHFVEFAPKAEPEDQGPYVFPAEAEFEAPAAEYEIVAETVLEDFDVPFLTGGPTGVDAQIMASEPDHAVAAAAPELAEVEMHGVWVEEGAVAETVDPPQPFVELAPAQPIAEVELTEDPATILAEIRARLAALDGRS